MGGSGDYSEVSEEILDMGKVERGYSYGPI